MALTVTFGNGGASTVSSLTNLVDQEAYELLTESTTQTKIGSSLDTGVVNVGAVTVPGSGTGGKVDVGYNAGTNGFTFDVSSAWNSVKNALAKSDSSETFRSRISFRLTFISAARVLPVLKSSMPSAATSPPVRATTRSCFLSFRTTRAG